MSHTSIIQCRICGSRDLESILNLGDMTLTSIFPKTKKEIVPSAPLELVRCGNDVCNLVQLRHSVSRETLYKDGYGYMSSLNKSMVEHLKGISKTALHYVKLKRYDVVIDVGSNDGTLLKSFPRCNRIGVDPINKFQKYYKNIGFINGYFEEIAQILPKAKVITSIAMFYDLEDPVEFAQNVADTLDDDGIWIIEQSFVNDMYSNISFDTICHEHLEYYGVKQINYIAKKVGLFINDISFNKSNGGSFRVVLSKKSKYSYKIHNFPDFYYKTFRRNVEWLRDTLTETINSIPKSKKIYGYGASTKGNVILQCCPEVAKRLIAIADVNKEKHGCFTPATKIPIISEEQARKDKPDYFLVLPWHFRDFIIKKEKRFLKSGKLIFPLPNPIIIGGKK